MIQPETIAGRYAAAKRNRENKNSRCRRNGGCVFVPLTKGYEAVIDESDLDLILPFSWFVCPASSVIYAKAYVPMHLREKWPTKMVSMHQVIMADKEIDHKDRNGLNCRRENLRYATRSQNGANRVWPRGKKSPFRGVSPCGNKWRSAIQVKRKLMYIGLFDTPEEAALAYNKQAVMHHGEFAVLNNLTN
jgi:hypothetical protein